MATTSMTKIREETNLAGVLKSQLLAAGLSLTVKFFDIKTGIQRTPQSNTLTFTLNKNNSKAERIRCTVHSTDANGITTLTIDAAGRSLPMYGVAAGAATGNQHEIGDPIGVVTQHEPTAQILGWIDGTLASGANALRIGDGTDSNIRLYANNADSNSPYVGYNASSNTWVVSNDGSSETSLPGGAGAYTAGDGLTLTASDFDIDLTDTTIFATTSAVGRVPVTLGTGKLDTSFITAAPLATYISDISVTATQINSVVGAFQLSFTTLEAIDGSSTPQYVAYGSSNMKDRIVIYDSNNELAASTGTNRNVGDVDATTRLRQSFVITDAMAASIAANDLTLFIRKQGTPADNFYVEIQTDSAGVPSGTVVTNGTSAVVAGGSLTTAYEPYNFTWSVVPTLTSGTTYHLVIRRSTANDAANYYQVLDANGNTYSGGTGGTYTASSTTWAAIANDIKMQLVFNISYGGKICKCDADNPLRSNGIGFIISSVGSGSSGDVYYDRHITFSGLTDGTKYVASTTGGSLVADSSSPVSTSIDTPIPHILAGQCFSGNKLKIGSYKRLVINDDKIGTFTAVAAKSFKLLVPVGFRPDEIILKYHYNDASATANATGHAVETRYVGLTEVGSTYVTEGQTSSATGTLLSTGSVTAASLRYGVDSTSPFSGGVALTAIYDNSVLLTLTMDATADVVGLQSLEFIKY